MSKISFFTIFLLNSLLAKIDYTYSYNLKKDEFAKVEIKKKDKKDIVFLNVRWTLFKANRLVLFVEYDKSKHQYILEKLYKRDRVLINLIGDFPNIRDRAYAMIVFRDFKDKKATIDIYIKDPQKRLKVRFQ